MISIESAFFWVIGVIIFVALWTPVQLGLQRKAESWVQDRHKED